MRISLKTVPLTSRVGDEQKKKTRGSRSDCCVFFQRRKSLTRRQLTAMRSNFESMAGQDIVAYLHLPVAAEASFRLTAQLLSTRLRFDLFHAYPR